MLNDLGELPSFGVCGLLFTNLERLEKGRLVNWSCADLRWMLPLVCILPGVCLISIFGSNSGLFV